MTADVIKGVSDKILEVGMNDYIPKPIEPDQMFSALNRWIKKDNLNKEKPLNLPELGVDKTEGQLPDYLPGLEINKGIARMMGKSKSYLSLLKIFSEIQKSYIDDIREAIKNQDFQTAERTAYTIKGVAGNISAVELMEVAGELQNVIAARNVSQYESLILLLENKIAIVMSSIEYLLGLQIK